MLHDPDKVDLNVRLATVCLDCDDSAPMVAFYSRFLLWEETHRDGDFVIMRDPRTGCHYSFHPMRARYRPPTWPEAPGEQDKQMHFEIDCADLEAGSRSPSNVAPDLLPSKGVPTCG